MTYQYKPSAKEQKAADRLRAKGWTVNPPACPDCGGLGSITETVEESPNHYSMSSKPCPRGCTVSYFYSWTNALNETGATLS